ncbi:hypothetical protein CBFG_05495 [Clostridiales bacterium 1_7_47FAA]|nr:hypothetical protein CBFG_05495 [Clostridiales bacterium 1_7_47FAA]
MGETFQPEYLKGVHAIIWADVMDRSGRNRGGKHKLLFKFRLSNCKSQVIMVIYS